MEQLEDRVFLDPILNDNEPNNPEMTKVLMIGMTREYDEDDDTSQRQSFESIFDISFKIFVK